MTYSGRSSAQLATRVVFNSGVLTTSYDIEAFHTTTAIVARHARRTHERAPAHQLFFLHERSDHPDAVFDRHPPPELRPRQLLSREPARLGPSLHVLPPLVAPRGELLRAASDQALSDLQRATTRHSTAGEGRGLRYTRKCRERTWLHLLESFRWHSSSLFQVKGGGWMEASNT